MRSLQSTCEGTFVPINVSGAFYTVSLIVMSMQTRTHMLPAVILLVKNLPVVALIVRGYWCKILLTPECRSWHGL